jgi:hypothetical protein
MPQAPELLIPSIMVLHELVRKLSASDSAEAPEQDLLKSWNHNHTTSRQHAGWVLSGSKGACTSAGETHINNYIPRIGDFTFQSFTFRDEDDKH